MSQIGKMIQNRIDWARVVLASIERHHEPICTVLAGRLGLEEDEWRELFDGMVDELGDAADALYDAEVALSVERGDDAGHRERRDTLTGELRGRAERARDFVAGAVGQSGLERYGLVEAAPHEPKALVGWTGRVVSALRDEPDTLVDPLGIELDTAEVADQLDDARQALVDQLAVLAEEAQDATDLLGRRDQALDIFEQVFRAVAGMAEHAYRLAGREDLAERVRPTIRRATGSEAPAEDAGGGEAPGVDGPAADEGPSPQA